MNPEPDQFVSILYVEREINMQIYLRQELLIQSTLICIWGVIHLMRKLMELFWFWNIQYVALYLLTKLAPPYLMTMSYPFCQ